MRDPGRPGTPRRSRGSTAIEFALLAPVLLVILLGMLDYGWYFFQEGLVTNAIQQGMRAGALQIPDPADAVGECSTCQSIAAEAIVAELATLGLTVSANQVTPTVEAIGSTCALVLQSELGHAPLAGLVPLPTFYNVRVVAFAQSVSGC